MCIAIDWSSYTVTPVPAVWVEPRALSSSDLQYSTPRQMPSQSFQFQQYQR
jgi:hypothetical protein